MNKLIKCTPNFSEGKNLEIIEAVINEVKNVPGVSLIDYSSDPSHNRTVTTLLGGHQGIENAAVALAKKCAELIDMTKHKGEHPRMGAVDVIPLTPIRGIETAECIDIAKKIAARIWNEAGMPSFLYEDAATAPHRVNLADIRKGQFEGMAKKVLEEPWTPDFGERAIHPTAGIVAIGVRATLIGFNINLGTSNVDVAKQIAKVIRRSSGGLECVKALGMMMEDKGLAQVSINMTNYNKTPLYRVLELVKVEAARWGVYVVGTEVKGSVPMKAFIDSAEYYLQLENFDFNRQILENHILQALDPSS